MKEVIMQVKSFSIDYPKAPIYVGDLVRCKDCKHYLIDGFDSITGWCYEFKNSVFEDDYCSYGERKGGENE